MKKVEQKDVIQFIKEHIIHRFGIPRSITTDQGTMFTRDEMTYFSKDYGIQLIRSTLFYPQENGKVEASNKVLINIPNNMLEENPRDWHRILSKTFWAYRTFKRDSIRVSLYSLTYGYDAVLPMEVVLPSLRVSRQNDLNLQEYNEAMMMELEAFNGKRLQVLDHIMIREKKRWLAPTISGLEERVMKKGSSFGRWCYPSVLKTEKWGNGLLTGRDYSKFTKYCPEMPISYQTLKESHTKGSSMERTLRNIFPQCGKCWIMPRKIKIGNKGVKRKIGLTDYFVLGKIFLIVTLSDKVGDFGHSLLKPLYSSKACLLYPQLFYE